MSNYLSLNKTKPAEHTAMLSIDIMPSQLVLPFILKKYETFRSRVYSVLCSLYVPLPTGMRTFSNDEPSNPKNKIDTNNKVREPVITMVNIF